MKTLKDFLEVYKPKSPDEQKFVDKHVTIKHKDRNGNGDDVFNGNTKTIKRKEERHGYDAGEDEKVYEELELGEEIEFELSEDVEELEEGTVGYKNYTITSHPKMAGAGEGGDIKHVYGHPKKMGKLGIEHDDSTDYGTTRRVTVKNNETGETTHHHVYQSERSNSTGKPTLSIRTVGKARAQQDKHANVIAHYLSGKTKIKEDTDLAFFEDLLEMNLDEDTFTDASLAQLRVMKHKQEMKKIESSSKLHPLMKVRRLSDAKKKLADLEKARDHFVAKHEKAEAKKKKVTEEVEELDELSKDTLSGYRAAAKHQGTGIQNKMKVGGGDWSKDGKDTKTLSKRLAGYKMAGRKMNPDLAKSVNKDVRVPATEEVEIEEKHLTPAEMKKREEIAKAMEREHPGMDKSKKMAIATAQAKKVAEEVEELDEGLMHDRYLRSHGKKARGTGSWAFTTKQYGSPKENEMHFTSGQKSLSDAHKEAAAKLGTKHLYVMEEVEELDELSKATLGSYVRNAQGTILAKGMEMQQQVNRGSNDEARRKTSKKVTNRLIGVNRAVDRLTKEDIINRAIANYMPEDAEPYTLEDRLLDKIEHIPESHAATLLVLFNELSEENQKTMLETVETQEGINSLLDFAINNRGE